MLLENFTCWVVLGKTLYPPEIEDVYAALYTNCAQKHHMGPWESLQKQQCTVDNKAKQIESADWSA